MTKDELDKKLAEPYVTFVYCDKEGLRAKIPEGWHYAGREFDVGIGCAGIIEEVNSDSIRVRWDHYDFEDHTKNELLPNPETILSFNDLDLVRPNKYPEGFRLIAEKEKNKPCSECGDKSHAYCSNKNGSSYILGHSKFFGAIIGNCPHCNSLIGSAIGKCDASHCVLNSNFEYYPIAEREK